MDKGERGSMGDIDELIFIIERELLSRSSDDDQVFAYTKGMKVKDICD